jgi:hypothetical protein
MSLQHPGRVEYLEGGLAGGKDGAVGKGNPLTLVWTEELVADRPVRRLVLAPVGVDLSGDLRGQRVGQALHQSPRLLVTLPSWYLSSRRPSSAAGTGRAAATVDLSPPRPDDRYLPADAFQAGLPTHQASKVG